jgi:tripeptidyl-peptidase-2
VVDIIDATGCGDVKLREAKLVDSSDKSLVLQGSSGRQLLLNASWKNPSNVWKVAHKAAYDLWPDDLVSRRKRERKAAFDKVQA